ncbi:MAG: BrnT family toxin [Acidobacteriaceae bacterium]
MLLFRWDETKAAINKRKHGITFDDALHVFEDPYAIFEIDRIVEGEARWQTLGAVDESDAASDGPHNTGRRTGRNCPHHLSPKGESNGAQTLWAKSLPGLWLMQSLLPGENANWQSSQPVPTPKSTTPISRL